MMTYADNYDYDPDLEHRQTYVIGNLSLDVNHKTETFWGNLDIVRTDINKAILDITGVSEKTAELLAKALIEGQIPHCSIRRDKQ